MARTTNRKIDNIVVQRIVDIIHQRGKQEKDLTDYLGLSPGSMSRWKYDGSYVYTKYIYEICEYLDTTPNYLFFGPEDEEERLTPDEKEMIQMYRSLDAGRKRCIWETIGYFKEGSRKRRRKVMDDDSVEKPLL